MPRRISLKHNRSGKIAAKRLKILLITDQFPCTSQMLEMIKSDIIHAVSRYMDINSEEIEIQLSKNGPDQKNECASSLLATIPIHKISYKGTV